MTPGEGTPLGGHRHFSVPVKTDTQRVVPPSNKIQSHFGGRIRGWI